MRNLPEWYLGLSKTKLISAGLLVVGVAVPAFLETGNNRFHRMLGGIMIQPTCWNQGGTRPHAPPPPPPHTHTHTQYSAVCYT